MDAHVHDQQALPATATEADSALTLTPAAAEMARLAMQREGAGGQALRVSVVGGGCSGSQYSLGFDGTVRADDVISEQHGIRLVVDAGSLAHLRGTVIDYVHGLHGAGFKFINPNASRTCGCGSSFST